MASRKYPVAALVKRIVWTLACASLLAAAVPLEPLAANEPVAAVATSRSDPATASIPVTASIERTVVSPQRTPPIDRVTLPLRPPPTQNSRLPRADRYAAGRQSLAAGVAASLRDDASGLQPTRIAPPPTAGIPADTMDEPTKRLPAPPATEGAFLPPGCTSGWSAEETQSFATASRGFAPPLGYRDAQQLLPADNRPTTMARPSAARLTATPDDLLGDDLLGNDLLGDDPLSPAVDQDPLSALQAIPATSGDSDRDDQPHTGDRTSNDHGAEQTADKPEPGVVDPHAELFLKDQYPSAQSCAQCHPTHYDEWRVSAHAYAAVSPMFQRFEQAMQELTRGTVGSFCVRCHAPVATQLDVPRHLSILDAPTVIREGITCVACHRVNEAYWLTNGDRRIEPGNAFAPIYSSTDGQGVHRAIADAKELKLKRSPQETGPGQPMHGHGFFAQLSKSDFCAPCHQVAVDPGIGLEIVHAQFRAGPAHARGVTCQDCHMGAVPGKAEGYELDYCAIINEKPWGEPRKHSNHSFWGPNYSIAHPGIFPHNKDANRYTPRQWLEFDYRAGWGTESFEQNVSDSMKFPPPWDTKDDRIDGRKVIDANLKKLQEKRAIAATTLSAGGLVEGPFFKQSQPRTGQPLAFQYKITNQSDGHNFPTGSLGAQPQLWLNVVLIGPDGRRLWETGYLDSNGDLADMNSYDVATGHVPRDAALFNLQTKFMVNNVRGTDREAPLPINFSVDPNPFLRPATIPVSVLNHPPLIRMEAHSIAPLDHRIAHYRVPGHLLTMPGQYRLTARMRSRPEPPYFMRLVRASPEMIQRLNENIIDFRLTTYTFTITP